MFTNIIRAALWQTIVLLGLFVWAFGEHSLDKARTFVFTTLIMFQMFNAFNCRSLSASVFSSRTGLNKYLIAAVLFSIGLQLCVVYLPFMNRLFGTVPLHFQDWFIILALSITIIPYIEIIKFFKRKCNA